MPHVSFFVGSLAGAGFLSGLGGMVRRRLLCAVGVGGLRWPGRSRLRLLGRRRCAMPCIWPGWSSVDIGRGLSTLCRCRGLLLAGSRRLSLFFPRLLRQERVALQRPAFVNREGCDHQHGH
ncbi:MAG: hypothetical protein MUC98_15815 [Desulfobacterota bacterium]|nr:hypothetical protein [Thermodesulfobacteriota bacterium]